MITISQYKDYKDSGIEWIGEIPRHWVVGKLGFYTSKIGSGLTPKGGSEIYSESGIPFIRSQNVHFQGLILDNVSYIDIDIHNSMSGSKVSYNDVLLNITGGSIGRCCVVQVNQEMNVNQHVCIIRTNNKLSPYYLNYLLSSTIGQSQVTYNISGGNREGLTVDGIKDIIIDLPPLSEQEQIVSYLDEKTSLIDEMVEKKKRKIELLKEFRTSLINTVVTKGLNPDVPMKDSGIEWIGEIPRHWKCVKLGHYSCIIRGSSPRPSGDPKLFDGSFIPWITVSEVTNSIGKYIYNTEIYLTEEGMKQSRVVDENTLLLSNSGATLGVPKITKIVGCINDGSVGITNIDMRYEQEYVYYFLTTLTMLLREQQSGYGQPNLNTDIISGIKVPLPPFSEQEQIVSYLDEKTSEIDKTIELENKKIELLKEYRQSLISNVVTGKIKVVSE